MKNKEYKITKNQLIKELGKTNMPNAEDIIKRVCDIENKKILNKLNGENVIMKEETEILKKELIKECEEHQQAMLYADKQITELKRALEMACEMLAKKNYKEVAEWFDSTKLTAKDIEGYLRMKARKELDNEI